MLKSPVLILRLGRPVKTMKPSRKKKLMKKIPAELICLTAVCMFVYNSFGTKGEDESVIKLEEERTVGRNIPMWFLNLWVCWINTLIYSLDLSRVAV